jgi:hypothetical protein
MIEMHLRQTIAAVAATAALAVPATALAQDAAKGASLLAEARKALGGEDKLAAVKRLQVNGEFKRAQGNNTNEGDFEIFIESPDKYRLNEETGFAGGPTTSRTQVLNGTEVWDETSSSGFPGGGRGGFGGDRGGGDRGGGDRGFGGRGRGDLAAILGGDQQGRQGQGIDPERLKEAQRRQRQTDLSRYLIAWLLSTDQPVTWIGTAESPDGNADVLEVTPQGGVATRVFLDVKTHMPLMLTWQGAGGGRFGGGQGGGRFGGGRGNRGDGAPPSNGGGAAAPQAPAGGQSPAAQTPASGDQPQGRRGGGQAAQVTNEMHLSEYKAVNGVKLPFLITRGANGQTVEELSVKSYKINPNFKANTFIK